MPTFPEAGYAIDWPRFERAITPRTRVIVAITPANPTGHVLRPSDVQALAELAERHNLMVISHESYDRLVYDGGTHLSPAANSVGYMVGPAPTISVCLKIVEWQALYGSYVPQAAAAAALSGPQHWLSDVADEFQQRDVFPDVSRLAAGEDPGDWLLREWGISAVDGALLGGPGRVRLAFGADDLTFDKLTQRLRAAFSTARAPVGTRHDA